MFASLQKPFNGIMTAEGRIYQSFFLIVHAKISRLSFAVDLSVMLDVNITFLLVGGVVLSHSVPKKISKKTRKSRICILIMP
jgi:hypothetical protein